MEGHVVPSSVMNLIMNARIMSRRYLVAFWWTIYVNMSKFEKHKQKCAFLLMVSFFATVVTRPLLPSFLIRTAYGREVYQLLALALSLAL